MMSYSTNHSLEILQTQNVFIPDTVILETEWVLRFAYKFQRVEICEALTKLFGLPNVHLNNAKLLVQVLQWHEAGLDFADAFHLDKLLVLRSQKKLQF